MAAVGSTGDLRKQLISEVSRVQTSNLRRVESAPGMKTIFSSADYQNTLGQPKPRFKVTKTNNYPRSPGRSRVRMKANDHKSISADLFQKKSVEKSGRTNSENTPVTAFISNDNPLATSTLKTDTGGVSHVSKHEQQRVRHTQDVTETLTTDSTSNTIAEQNMRQGVESTPFNYSIEKEDFRKSTTSNDALEASSVRPMTNSTHSVARQVLSTNSNASTSDRAETEVTLPNTKIQHTVGMSGTESTMTEEDHAIQALLSLAEGQEAEMNEADARKAAQTQEQTVHKQLNISSSLGDSFKMDNETNDISPSGIKGDLTDPTSTEPLLTSASTNDDVTVVRRNTEEFNSIFDLKEIVSSTPQTRSEVGSVHSGTGSRPDSMNGVKPAFGEERGGNLTFPAERFEPVSFTKENSNINTKGLLVQDNTEISRDIEVPDKIPTGGIDDPTQPSQEDIDETHQRFDEILADLDTSTEEDFTTSEKIIGKQLSSEAEVIVHSSDEDFIKEPETYSQAYEAHALQEFTDLEHSRLSEIKTSLHDKRENAATNDLHEDAEQELVLSRMKSTTGGNDLNSSMSSDHESESGNNVEKVLDVSTPSRLAENVHSNISEQETRDVEAKVSRKLSTNSNVSNHSSIVKTVSRSPSQEFKDITATIIQSKAEDMSMSNKNTSNGDSSSESHQQSNVNVRTSNVQTKETAIYSEIPNNFGDSNDQVDSPLEQTNKGIYSEAYDTGVKSRTERDSVSASESSCIYESISGEEGNNPNNSVTKEGLSDNTSEHLSDTFSNNSQMLTSGRLSPLGAEVDNTKSFSSKETRREENTIGLATMTNGRLTRETVGSEPIQSRRYGFDKSAGTPIPRMQPGLLNFSKAKSDYKTLSDNVNVKGLAKQLEKTLDFSRILNSQKNDEIEQRENRETTKGVFKKPKITTEDPRSAFGLVLSEISQFTKLRHVPSDNDIKEKHSVTEEYRSQAYTTESSVSHDKTVSKENPLLSRESSLQESIKTEEWTETTANIGNRTGQHSQNPSTVNSEDEDVVTVETTEHFIQTGVETEARKLSGDDTATKNEAVIARDTFREDTDSPNHLYDTKNKFEESFKSREEIKSVLSVDSSDNNRELRTYETEIETGRSYGDVETFYGSRHNDNLQAEIDTKRLEVKDKGEVDKFASYYNEELNSSQSKVVSDQNILGTQDKSYESETDQSFASVSTLQDREGDLSDFSYLKDALVSRNERITTAADNSYLGDYDRQRDTSRRTSLSEDTYTSVHEEFYVPVPNQQVDSLENNKVSDKTDAFPSYRELYYSSNRDGENGSSRIERNVTTKSFQHEPYKESVSGLSGGYFDSYPSVNGSGVGSNNRQTSRESSSAIRRTEIPADELYTEQAAEAYTVEGSSVRQAYSSAEGNNILFISPSGYDEKPAQQLHDFNTNIAEKEDRSDHVTFSSSNQPLHVEQPGSDSDVTTPRDNREEFFSDGEKLSEITLSPNLTSESRPTKYEHTHNGSHHSLFYDSSSDEQQVKSVRRNYNPRYSRDTAGNKYQRGSMAYLLTGRENTTVELKGSGRSTPRGKDLYMEEHITVSPTGVDERRSSHSSRDYLADNHGEQELFHFNMKSPGNHGLEEERGERIQQVEQSERRIVTSGQDSLELLPDTYIGTSKAPESIPVRKTSASNSENRSTTVSQNSSTTSVNDSSPYSGQRNFDYVDGKTGRGKKSDHKRIEHVTTYTSSQTVNGTDGTHSSSTGSGYPRESNVIRIDTNSTGFDSGRRDRRHGEVTSKRAIGKPSGDDNLSISSLSSQSSTSIAEAATSIDAGGSRNHQRAEKRTVYTEETTRSPNINVDFNTETRIHSSENHMPKHTKSPQENRTYYSTTEPDMRRKSDHERGDSTKEVQYLIKSLEKESKQPRRPIPGVDRDAFSYHVTTSSNENKSTSRKNHVNEIDVTTREAMRDREIRGQGSSQVIKRYKEERIVEDVTPSSSIHLSPETGRNGNRTIILQNGQAPEQGIVFHPPASLDRSDSDLTGSFEDSKRGRKKGKGSAETTVYVDSSSAPHSKVKSEKIRVVNKENTYHKGHSVSSDDSSDEESRKRRKAPESGKVSTVLYDFSSDKHPSLSNVVHLEGAKGLKSKDSVYSQDIYSTPRNTDRPIRTRSSSESSLSDTERKKRGVVSKNKSEELWLTNDLNRSKPRQYKSENVFYEHYHVKRDNPMYLDGDKTVYVTSKHGARSPTREIYVDNKTHSPARHHLSSSFSSISPTGSPTPDDKHVTTVSFDESFNRKRSASPMSENVIYKPKVHVKKHRVVKTDQQIIRPAESDNELYVRGSRSSPYRVMVKGDRHRSGRSSDTDESFYSDGRTTGSHKSTINIAKDRRPDPNAPAVMSIPLSREPVAMTIPAVHETRYVTNKSERVELKRSASLDSVRDMVDYPTDLRNSQSFRSEKMLHLGSSSESPSSPEMRSPSSPYVSTITILNRKLNVKEPNVDSGTGTEIISSDDDIRYRSQLNPVKEEVTETKQQRRSEKHTTYTTYEEYRDRDNYEYVTPSQHRVTTVRQQRTIPIREERIQPVREDRARAVRESLHQKFNNMSYEQSQEPQQVEQKSSSDLKVVRGQFVIRNSMDIDLEEGDSLGLDDNINIFDNSFTMNKENPLYQSDPDIYNKFESETVEQRTRRIKEPLHGKSERVARVTVDEVDAFPRGRNGVQYRERETVGSHRKKRRPFSPSSIRYHYDSNDLDVPYAEGDFGDGFEDIIQNTRQAAVKSAPNKKKQNLSQMLLSRLAQIDSKDITQHIDVEHHNEEIYGDIKFIHADGSKAEAMDTTNFDSVSEHIDLMLKEGKALITIKVTAERIIPIDFEFNVWRKSQAIVTRNIEIDLKANDQRRRLYDHVMETTPRKMIGSGSSRYEDNEAVLSSKDTLKLFSRLLSVAEKDDKAVERDEVRYETKHRERSDSLPSLSNADMLY